MQFIDLSAQYEAIKDDVGARIQTVLTHGKFIMGPEVAELEERLADYVGVKHCIGVASGTDALLIAMMALGVGRDDEVITTPFSFISTAETIVLLGAKPVFVDIDPRTYNIDPGLIESAITKRTKAIMPVSLYGQCADMDAINAIAERQGLPVIEDGAQSFGATYKGRKSCSLTTIGCTSFFPSKPLGCYGDGGACFTNDDALAKAMREIRVHGQDRRYHHSRIGINGRLDTIQAAVLLAKLTIFASEISARDHIGNLYNKVLLSLVDGAASTAESTISEEGRALLVPYIEADNTSVFAQYSVQVRDRRSTIEALRAAGIPTAVHYPQTLNCQPALGQESNQCPNALSAAAHVLSLPMYPSMPDTLVKEVAEVMARLLGVQNRDRLEPIDSVSPTGESTRL